MKAFPIILFYGNSRHARFHIYFDPTREPVLKNGRWEIKNGLYLLLGNGIFKVSRRFKPKPVR